MALSLLVSSDFCDIAGMPSFLLKSSTDGESKLDRKRMMSER